MDYLNWGLTWGEQLEWLLKLAKGGKVFPTALKNKPELSPGEEEYWDAYVEIAGSRQWTDSGPAEIPYPTKILWLNENNISDPLMREDFLIVIKAIDQAYLDFATKKLEKLNGN